MVTLWMAVLACRPSEYAEIPLPKASSPLLGVPQTDTWTMPGLTGPAYVVRAEGSIPYIYAEDQADLARVTGFVVARDRYFMVDMLRRLALGRVAELLGNDGLTADQESRGIGMTRVADRVLALVEADPVWSSVFDAYAAGINAYVDEVHSSRQPPPSEYTTLGPVLGFPNAGDLVTSFDRRDMAAIAATLIYNLGFETTDVGRAEAWSALPGIFEGMPLETERAAGVVDDIFLRVEPVFPLASAPGWGSSGAARRAPAAGTVRPTAVPPVMFQRLGQRLARVERRFGHDRDSGFGSNAWAVAGSSTADGRTLLAGDGHLGLSIPPLFYQLGLDTEHLSGVPLAEGAIHQVGLALPGFPSIGVGTNGKVAWGQTQVFGDITDWYREELRLVGGVPVESRFQGEWKPLSVVSETYEIASVPFLGSVGRTETWDRFETFDGRLIAEIEGLEVSPDTVPGPGETLVNVQGTTVIPSDIDGDGVISAVSFDYTAFDDGNLMLASSGFAQAQDIDEFREATRRLVAYSQSMVASDADGNVFYSGYQAVPCREYLPRGADGRFLEGADPTRLIDGTQYGGFTIPVGSDGVVDESQGADPYKCVVPFDQYPQNLNPAEGFVMTANHDIGNISLDGDLYNDPYYIGGPWLEGYRADRLDTLLRAEVAAGTADIAAMSRIQGDHHSTVADQMLPWLLTSFDVGRAASAAAPGDPDTDRLAALWAANEGRFEEVEQRMTAWLAADLPARAGVETFYLTIEPGDADHAVATMIWNAWIGEFVHQVFDDEGFPSVFYPTGDTGRTRTLTRMWAGRGPGNPQDLSSWVRATQESAFFDVRDTPEVEHSDELVLLALEDALNALTGPSTGPGTGGFATADMDAWKWGYRHLVKFESIVAELLDADDSFGFLIPLFSVTPDRLPLLDGVSANDPLSALPWFPRHGDHLNVDAGNPGFARDEWMYGSGPVFRMVIALGPDGAEGVNVLPGGQSGLTTSAHFDDQAGLWLANETWPMRMTVAEVIAGAVGRETFHPAP